MKEARRAGVGVIVAALLTLAGANVSSLVQSAFTGKVVAVLDGDSLMVLDVRQQVEVRLHGVDAPEGSQAFGNVCKRTLSNLVFGKTAAVQVVDINRYKRRVSRLTVEWARRGPGDDSRRLRVALPAVFRRCGLRGRGGRGPASPAGAVAGCSAGGAVELPPDQRGSDPRPEPHVLEFLSIGVLHWSIPSDIESSRRFKRIQWPPFAPCAD